jgi:hypothetical protein
MVYDRRCVRFSGAPRNTGTAPLYNKESPKLAGEGMQRGGGQNVTGVVSKLLSAGGGESVE